MIPILSKSRRYNYRLDFSRAADAQTSLRADATKVGIYFYESSSI